MGLGILASSVIIRIIIKSHLQKYNIYGILGERDVLEVCTVIGSSDKKIIPIGFEDFKEIIDKNLYYVDKTMLIYEILKSGAKNNLITRPRRFGKTLNFSMLKYFFDIREKDSRYIFDGLKISEHFDELASYRNTHPVITLSLKGGKQPTYELAIDSLVKEIQCQASDFAYILESDKILPADAENYRNIISGDRTDEKLFYQAVKTMCRCLKQYYGTNTIILIDEYDVPLENAYFAGFYDKMTGFIRSLFESALKTNDALEFSVITGCLRISKESIFTGLNNLAVNSILSKKYSEHFGFVQSEVDDMLEYYDLFEKQNELKKWYDGYLFGNTEVYNPWSVVYQISEWLDASEETPKAHWINTSSNAIVRNLIEQADETVKEQIESLIRGESIEAPIRETITYGDMDSVNENIWSFLFFTGYLKVISLRQEGTKIYYNLVIPNLEIQDCYTDVIREYFDKYKEKFDKKKLFEALLNKDAEHFSKEVTELLGKSISYYDNKESFYHGLILGLLNVGTYYDIKSNRETGNGRYDIAIYQKDRFLTAIILELKICHGDDEPAKVAQMALNQINEKKYYAEAVQRGYKNILKYGIAFKDKICYAVVE